MPHPRDKNDADRPVSGYFAVRLVRGGVECAAQVIEHNDGTWSGLINGEPVLDGDVDVGRTFPDRLQNIWLFGRKVDKTEYDYLLARYLYYKENDPTDPRGNPKLKVNRRLMKPIGG